MPSVQGDDSNGLGFGVEGKSVNGVGVAGTSDQSSGVEGRSSKGAGVSGNSKRAEGVSGFSEISVGVRGESGTAGGRGVFGINTQGGVGVNGQSDTGIGVVGTSINGNGIFGQSDTRDGVAGESATGNGVLGQSRESNGVTGLTVSDTGSGVFGSNKQEGSGVTGISEAGFGVFGQTNAKGKAEDRLVAGVAGQCNGLGWGVLGLSPEGRAGVAGLSKRGDGVFGETHTDQSVGVHGIHRSQGDGVRGEGNNGVYGFATSGNRSGAGVKGENPVDGAAGVLGVAPNGFGVVGSSTGNFFVPATQAGVLGVSGGGPGVYGYSLNNEPAIQAWGPTAIQAIGNVYFALGDFGVIANTTISFEPNVTVSGTLTAGNKQFQIDHPLDPTNKYLNHASVESSEMKTIYDGVVILDAQGKATVELPDWFQSLNTSFRYQLTPIGAPAPELHIAEELSDNRFTIAGGSSNLKICWQITGIRHDAFARYQPLLVETNKPEEEQGYFLHPESYGHTGERSVAWVRNPDLMRSFSNSDSQISEQ